MVFLKALDVRPEGNFLVKASDTNHQVHGIPEL